MAFQNFLNKKVFLIVETDRGERSYSGVILEVNYMGKSVDNQENYLIVLEKFRSDKEKVGIMSSAIKLIEEEK